MNEKLYEFITKLVVFPIYYYYISLIFTNLLQALTLIDWRFYICQLYQTYQAILLT